MHRRSATHRAHGYQHRMLFATAPAGELMSPHKDIALPAIMCSITSTANCYNR